MAGLQRSNGDETRQDEGGRSFCAAAVDILWAVIRSRVQVPTIHALPKLMVQMSHKATAAATAASTDDEDELLLPTTISSHSFEDIAAIIICTISSRSSSILRYTQC